MDNELKQIKKIYGEEMMHLCRELFPTILEKKGKLLEILTTNIAPSHTMASDIRKEKLETLFKKWIYIYVDKEKISLKETGKTPFELMREAGYTLYECHSEEEIQSFKHYWRKDEELCTFWGGRLGRCHVFFAVKDGADKLNRNGFTNPQREDEYGTSVISIQFSRGEINTLSIKNRYNHTVNNPDATFSNNLENIIPGLTKSFEENYNYSISQEENEGMERITRVLKIVRDNNGKYYRYNCEYNGIYYCENNVIIKDGEVDNTYALNKEKYILIDHTLIDLKEKKITCPDKKDSFVKTIYELGEIKNINVVKNGENRLITINYENGKEIKLEINKGNSLIGYTNNYVKEIDSRFLIKNINIQYIVIPNVRKIKEAFAPWAKEIKEIDLPNVEYIDRGFLLHNYKLERLSAPKVKDVGNDFLRSNINLKSLDLPEVEYLYGECLVCNGDLEYLNLPKVQEIHNKFLSLNHKLTVLNLPSLRRVGDGFLYSNECVAQAYLPNLLEIGAEFLYFNKNLKHIDLPKVERIDDYFMYHNETLETINVPNVTYIGACFLSRNNSVTNIDLPNANTIENSFLAENEVLESINVPSNVRVPGNISTRIRVLIENQRHL